MVDTINPSITAGIGAGAQNPMQMIYQFAATQNALNQNALFQQTYRARQALGPLSQQAVGPDGQMDWNKYATLVSTHPDTAFMAPEILNQIAQKKLTDAQTMNAELVGTQQRMDIIAPILARAATDPKIQKGTDLIPYAQDIMAAGGIKDGNQRDMINLLTRFAPLQGAELKQRLTAFAQANDQARKTLSDINGQFDPQGGVDPATGQTIPIWKSSVTRTAQPMMSEAPRMAPVAAPPGNPDAPTQPNFQYGSLSPPQLKKLSDIESMRDNYSAQAARATDLQRVTDKLQYALSAENMHPGGGAAGYMEAAKFLQSLGVHNKTVDAVANGSLPAGQATESLSTILGTEAVRELLLSKAEGEGSAGRLTGMEWQKIVGLFPNVETDPRAAAYIFKFVSEQNRLRVAKAQAFNDTYDRFHAHQTLAGGMKDPTQFEPYWNQQLVKRGYITQDDVNNLPSLEGVK